ncbi:MAG: hypothetical protein ABSD76_08520 [Terriglobales bacterium]
MKSQLAEGWGQFLSQFPWDWFATLTFREEVKSFSAHRLFARFARGIERAAEQPIFWFRADEIGSRLGRFHIHALFGNVSHLRRLFWMDRWSDVAGYARILPFNDKRGAAYYCAKYLTKQDGDWEMSANINAFQQYQPSLPLTGPTKQQSILAQANVVKPDPRRTHSGGHPTFPEVLPNCELRGTSMISEVYKSEVTRGRGRFKEFFPPRK